MYNNPDVCKLEEKFSVVPKQKSTQETEDSEKSSKIAPSGPVGFNVGSTVEYVANYPLEPFRDGARGTYGGEFVAQSLVAAWNSILEQGFDIHSLHSYFLKAGLQKSVMRYEVTNTSQGRNYCSRMVKCYQLHTNELCFIFMASFTRNNNLRSRQEAFALLDMEKKFHPRTKVPFEFLRSPNYTFDKYKSKVDRMPHLEHTNGNLVHILLPEVFKGGKREKKTEPASREFGMFFKVLDNTNQAKNPHKAKMVDFAFASDSFYLSTVLRAVFPVLDYTQDFFRVSLDHTIYYHDTDFDPTEWMFLDYKFTRLSNDRVLVICLFFTMDKRLVATVLQEAMALFPFKLVEKSKNGSYKL